jgi:hypothetical protein
MKPKITKSLFFRWITSSKRWFTLFELMLGITIFAMLMIYTLEAVGNITIARTRSMSRITLIEELYFFSEKLATQIKEGGIIDYEEYWNRQVREAIASPTATGTASGHYILPTGFWNYGEGGSAVLWPLATNYWNGYYYCRSENAGNKIATGGCIVSSLNDIGTDQAGKYQRYGQYKLQFTDYNGNADTDSPSVPGDEDDDPSGSIRWDEDDKDVGDGPIVISGSSPELYLINTQTKERIFFRLTYKQDPNHPMTCNFSLFWTGCLWNIEILRLKWLDIGLGHSWGLSDATNPGAFDGDIDTWVCHQDWACNWPILPTNYGRLPTGIDSEWIPLFPEYVNVKQLTFSLYPRKDPWKSWAATDTFATWSVSPFLHPYVRVQMSMGLAWEKRKLINNDDPTISISTTISLANNITE